MSSPTEQQYIAARDFETPQKTAGEPQSPLQPDLAFRRSLYDLLNQLGNGRDPLLEPQGMRNPGTLCYRNSILQILLYNDLFMSFVNSYVEKHDNISGTMKHLKAISDYVATSPSEEDYKQFLDNIWKEMPYVKQNDDGDDWFKSDNTKAQRDAEEFLSYLFNAEIYQAEQKPDPDVPLLLRLHEMFHINRSNHKMCAVCGTQDPTLLSNKPSHDTVMRVGIDKKPRTLADLVAREFKGPAENWTCDTCRERKLEPPADRTSPPAPAWSFLRRLPEVFIMQLKRFADEPVKNRRGTIVDSKPVKNMVEVTIDEELDLGKHLNKRSTMQPWEKVNTKYDLVAVVAHSGNLKGGHYITHVKYRGKWYMLNNQYKYDSSFDQAVEHGPSEGGFQPYLLVWQRRHEVPFAEVEKMKADSDAAPAAPKAASVARAQSSPKGRTSAKSPVASAREATSTVATQATQANPTKTSSEGRTAAKTPSAAARPPLPTPAELKSTARPHVDAPKKISPPQDPDDLKTYLRVKLGLAGKYYYIHHSLNSLGRTPVEARKQFEQAKVDLSVHLVNDLPDGVNAQELDLAAAATESIRPKGVQRKRKSLQICSCGLLHEGACGGVANKRLRRNDWHSKGPSLYPKPLSAAHRAKVHAAVKAAGKEWAEKYKPLLMRSPVFQPVRGITNPI
jgi:ubiquitin C-terminal hydrolase